MTRRHFLLAAFLLLFVFVSRAGSAAPLSGWASAYAPGVMSEVIRYRLDNDLWRHTPPRDWYTASGAIATNDCSQVGLMATLTDPGGHEHRVLIADCGGDDGGADWMSDNNIAAELDWRLWTELTGRHGKPLKIAICGGSCSGK